MNPGRIGRIILLLTVIAALLAVAGGLDVRVAWRSGDAWAIDLFGSKDDEESAAGEPFWTEGTGEKPVVPHDVPAGFADLAERASPGVVNIKTSKTVHAQEIPRVFEEFFGFPHPGRGGRERKVPSLGTGFVISPDGFIATNNHVIADVDSITVVFEDGKELDAEIIGRDPKTDIALIRVKADDLFSLPLGNSDSVRPGEWVVAIGNPFGLEHTVTAGIVSAKHRFIGQGSYDDYIQTDAAINPGNSGGPLLNLSGEVVGINTLINPQANTIGFAVPINMAKDILPMLRASGRVTRGWLGVMINPVRPEFMEHLDVESDTGALVSQVLPNGPAEAAGIQEYDIIIEFDGQSVDTMNDLPRLVARTPVDKKVEVVVLREGKRKTLTARITAMESDEELEVASLENSENAFGLRVQKVTPELARQLGVEEAEGLVITSVEPGSAAREAGLRRGDVILEVNRAAVDDEKELRARLRDDKSSALLLIRRGDATLFIALKRDAD